VLFIIFIIQEKTLNFFLTLRKKIKTEKAYLESMRFDGDLLDLYEVILDDEFVVYRTIENMIFEWDEKDDFLHHSGEEIPLILGVKCCRI
jgi:hypothetical protein